MGEDIRNTLREKNSIPNIQTTSKNFFKMTKTLIENKHLYEQTSYKRGEVNANKHYQGSALWGSGKFEIKQQ